MSVNVCHQRRWRLGWDTNLSLPRQPVKLLKPGASYTPFEDAIVLLGVDVEGLLVEGWIVLDLVDMGLRLTLVAGVGIRLRL